jgi:ankyrin repeat protein
MTRLLVENGADVNESSRGGGKSIAVFTPLMSACRQGARDTVLLLLRHGARTEKDWTPLMWAAEKGHDEVARKILEAGTRLSLTACAGCPRA